MKQQETTSPNQNPTDIRYFAIRRYNCGVIDMKGKAESDIIGITTDEEYAKSRQSVFCDYEEVKMIKQQPAPCR